MLKVTVLFLSLLMLLSSAQLHGQDTSAICKYPLSQLKNLQLRQQASNKALAREFNYDVKYYKTNWYIDPSQDSIRGSVLTVFKVVDPYFSVIAFDMDTALHVDSIIYHGAPLFNYSFPNYGPIHITFPMVPLKNTLDSIAIFYHGQPNKAHRGFVQDYHNNIPIIWSLSEPYYANDWWPCKQDLDDKADSVDITITVPQYCKAASNGKLLSVTKKDTFSVYHWHHNYPITPYLVGISVTKYNEFSDYLPLENNDSMLVLNYVFPESETEWHNNEWGLIPALQTYGKLFGRYPFWKEKYGNAQFTFRGGQEHQTMSFVLHIGFGLMVHEMAHQWFGDKVTCHSWQDIWLNEGFATYCEVLSTENILSHDLYLLVKHSKLLGGFYLPDQSVSVDDTTSVSRIFSSPTTYDKASMVLHMLRKKLGDEIFFKSIQEYLNDSLLAYSFAQTIDLRRHFEQNAGYSLSKYFDDWIYKKGYPYYKINYQQDAALNLHIDFTETPYDPSVTHYEIPPMPLRVWSNGVATDYKLNVDSATKKIILPLPGAIDSLKIDAEEDILFKYELHHLDSGMTGKVYLSPNPASTYITLFINDINLRSEGNYSITDATGRNILSGNYSHASELKINIQNLSNGVYIFNMHSGTYTLTKKFVKGL